MSETILTNAQIVLPDEVVRGSVLIRNGENRRDRYIDGRG